MNAFRETLHCLPIMGVGFGFNFDLPLTSEDVVRLRRGNLGGFDYIEVQAPHVLLFHDMWEIIEAAPTIIYCSQFSLGSTLPKSDSRFNLLTKEVMTKAKTPWFAEHISLSQFPGGDTRHFFLPYLDGTIAENVVRNSISLQRLMNVPMLLENAHRLFDVTCAAVDEGTFIKDIVNEADCGYLLDLSSARKTCPSLGYDLRDYISRMSLDVLVEMHVGDIVIEKELALDLIRSCPIKTVMLEANLSKAKDFELREFVETINHELRKKENGSRIAVPSMPESEVNVNGSVSSTAELSCSVKFSEGTSITLYSDHLSLHSHGGSTTLLPLKSSEVVSDVLLGKSMESILN